MIPPSRDPSPSDTEGEGIHLNIIDTGALMITRMHLFAVFMFVVVLCGCNSKTVVTGKVTYKNEPIARGDIHFVGADGQSRSAVIADGAYTMEDPPLGKVKVAVEAVAVSTKKEAAPSVFEKKNILTIDTPTSPLPARFSDPEKSNLVYDIKRGQQAIDIQLKD
jgi:hypothetical protein